MHRIRPQAIQEQRNGRPKFTKPASAFRSRRRRIREVPQAWLGLALLALACGNPSADDAQPGGNSSEGLNAAELEVRDRLETGTGSESAGASEGASPGSSPGAQPFAGQRFSRDAKIEVHEMLRADMALPRHPSDGQGRGFLDRIETPAGEALEAVIAGSHARFHLRFAVGPLGIADGGYVFLQSSPFWRWGTPQFEDETAPGFTTVAIDAEGVELETTSFGGGLASVQIHGRALEAGEELRFVYGAGAAGVRVDDHAEHEERVWFMVDGDGDGYRRLVDDSPMLTVLPSVPARLVLTLPTTARVNQDVTLTAALLDLVGNRGVRVAGVLDLQLPEGVSGPAKVAFEASDAGVKQIELRVNEPGIFRVPGVFRIDDSQALFAASSSSEWKDEATREPLEGRAGPLVIGNTPPVLWGDFHGHTALSDGTGTPEDYFRYAREIAALDVVALTDHDHWGLRLIDERPELWKRIQASVRAAHAPGRFVALLGYEWTSWLHGHRHVLYFEEKVEDGEIFSSLDPKTESPAQLWQVLKGRKALTFAHHSAGGPVSTNWAYPPDPILEPVTEIVSVHGSSEAPLTTAPIYDPVAGNYVRDALNAGYPLGLIGSGDSHDGHPGLAHIGSPSNTAGLAALVGAEHTRESVLAALRRRSVYATNGSRIWLRAFLEGQPMGSRIARPAPGPQTADSQTPDPQTPAGPASLRLEVSVAGTAPLLYLDIVGPSSIGRVELDGVLEWSGAMEVPVPEAGHYLYVRATQEDDGTAWSSPFFCCD